jgi:hypothetical protein
VVVTSRAVTCSDGFGFVALRYWAGTGLSRTMSRVGVEPVQLAQSMSPL